MRLLMVLAAALFVHPSFAQVPLWRTLESGDEAAVIKNKLEQMPEVDRVKSMRKNGEVKLDVNMKRGGVAIFGNKFKVFTAFEEGRLNRIMLSSTDRCANESYEIANEIIEQLQQKYPVTDLELPTSLEFTNASINASPQQSVTLSSFMKNTDVAVLLSVEFRREERIYDYPSGPFGRLAYELLTQEYDKRASQCGGTGNRRAEVNITYLPVGDYERLISDHRNVQDANRAEALRNL